jgi:hypothetical protein
MPFYSAKSSSEILVKVEVKKISADNNIEEFDYGLNKPPKLLSSKIGEYIVRIGDANDFCFNIIIQLLAQGKVRVDFRNATERLQLMNKQNRMSRIDAVQLSTAGLKKTALNPPHPRKRKKSFSSRIGSIFRARNETFARLMQKSPSHA